MEKIIDLFNESVEVKLQIIRSDAANQIAQMADLISNSVINGGKLLLCGNGGSAADAQHLATELIVRLRPYVNRRAVPAISLAVDTSMITACGNDISFDEVFVRSLEALANPGDVLLGISTSGNSENVKRAILRAGELGVNTCTFLGGDGGGIKALSDVECIVPSNKTGRVQEAHIMLGHALMETIEDRLLKDGYI